MAQEGLGRSEFERSRDPVGAARDIGFEGGGAREQDIIDAIAAAVRGGKDLDEVRRAGEEASLSGFEQGGLSILNFVGSRLTGGTQRPAFQGGQAGLAGDFSLGPALASLAPGIGGAAATLGGSPLVAALAKLAAKGTAKATSSSPTGSFISRAEIDADLAAKRAQRLTGRRTGEGEDEPTPAERAAASVTPVPEPDLDSLSLALAILQNRGRTLF